ncbi:MAG: gamma-glutamyl-gamma-aminobutyrate hydrolase family protein [Gemmatimonadales bacterium]
MSDGRPLIGITTQTLQAIDDIPADLPLSWVMNQRYAHAIVAAGGVPVLVPLLDDEAPLRTIFDRVDGLLLPGGVDIDPGAYRTAPEPVLGRIDPARDATEIRLTRWALAEEKPLLGLCRGLQVISVACGGTLWQDLAADRPDSIKHDYFPTAGWSRDHLAHDVAIGAGTRLAGLLRADTLPVNSMHHQGIRELGPRLIPAAIAPDGLIEGAEATGDGFAVAVQWHPESLAPGSRGVGSLFDAFVDAAGVRARR